ncbi:MAG: heavy metal-binding domain-containing protein [Gemmatimonadetes bacterium]|nr:heavy metal-binding domain-containing protein [Gemmatimonadota bacterium]
MRRAYYAALGLVGSHDDALDLSQEAFSSREPFSLQSWARLFCSCRSRGRNGSLIGRTLIRIFKDDRMCAHAKTLGANAVIGTRFNSSYVMGSASEILAYGTAVIVEPESSP